MTRILDTGIKAYRQSGTEGAHSLRTITEVDAM